MDVIRRNFFRLIKNSVFGGDEVVEPMSNWKWNQLLVMAGEHGVDAIVMDGIRPFIHKGTLCLKKELLEKWNSRVIAVENSNHEMNIALAAIFKEFSHQQLRPILMKGLGLSLLYPMPEHRTCRNIDIFFSYLPQADKADIWAREYGKNIDDSDKRRLGYYWMGVRMEHHRHMQVLMNRRLNKQLQRIVNGEIRCCDSSYISINGVKVEVLPPTMNLLLLLTNIARKVIDDGLDMQQVVDLGLFLRKMGDKVDFVKFQLWIESLKMVRMAQVIGILLVKMFDFDKEEVPFVHHEDDAAAKILLKELMFGGRIYHFQPIENVGTLRKETHSMFFHLRRCSKYIKCYPREVNSTAISRIAHSLDQVEE
jgi:hypothetical protein